MRILGTIAGVVNLTCMFLAAIEGDMQTFLIAWAGASFSGYAILHTLEERQHMGETRIGFRALAMTLRYDLQQQHLPPGTRLPSLGDYARKYGTTRTTVARALRILEEDGIVVMLRGRGTYTVGVRDDRPKDRIAWELLDAMKDKPSGSPFPSSAEIMLRYNVSHPTARKVHKEFIDKGYIRRTREGGYVTS